MRRLLAALLVCGLSGAAQAQGVIPALKIVRVDGAPTAPNPMTSAGVAAGPVDATGFASISCTATSLPVGNTVTFQDSPDGLSWSTTTGVSGATGAGVQSIISPDTVSIPRKGKYVRALVSTYASGTVNVVCQATVADAPAPTVLGLTGNPLVTPVLNYNSAPLALTTGQQAGLQGDATGALYTRQPDNWTNLDDTRSALGAYFFGGFIDTTGYGSGSITLYSNAANNSITWEGTNDQNIAPVGFLADQPGSGQKATASAQSIVSIFNFNIPYRYIRVRMNAYNSGSTSVKLTLRPGLNLGTTQYVQNPFNVGSFLSPKPTPGGSTGTPTTSSLSVISTASTNAQALWNSGKTVYKVWASNQATSARFVRFYNLAAAPTPASSVPTRRYMLPPGFAGFLVSTEIGHPFGTGVAIDITAGAADTDTTAAAANDVILNVDAY